MPREPRGGNGDVGELIHRRIGNHAAIRHEHHAVFADARVLDFHDHAARSRVDVRRRLDDLEERPQQAAGDVRRAGNHAVGLVHRQHHRAVIIRLQHRLARLGGAQPFFPAQRMEALGEILQVLAVGGIDDADAVERNIQFLRDGIHLERIAEQDGRAQLQRGKLPRRLQDARLLAFGKNDPFGMPLQFFDDPANESHGDRLALKSETAKSICSEFPDEDFAR